MTTTIILSVLLIFTTLFAAYFAWAFRRGRYYNERLFKRCIDLQDEIDRLNRVLDSKNKK